MNEGLQSKLEKLESRHEVLSALLYIYEKMNGKTPTKLPRKKKDNATTTEYTLCCTELKEMNLMPSIGIEKLTRFTKSVVLPKNGIFSRKNI
ncbi:MAG: hypothetical protein ACI9V1_000930 [Spirosomataceae bacterium]|jgi:hypothetical protein